MYMHQDNLGNPIALPVGKAICVGRNYHDHIDEMRSEVPAEPLLFMKPKAAFCHMQNPLRIPEGKGECHNELEVAVLLKQPLCNASVGEVLAAIWGIGLGLDLTLRDVQQTLKQKGLPWERSKAFDFSCPLSGFVPVSQFTRLDDIHFSLTVNDQQRQSGNTAMMLHAIPELIAHMSGVFTLDAGDVILTGTPKGVAALNNNDVVRAELADHFHVSTKVIG
ncbi:fumarylacetoacetate hydrolase family protein [Alteromonas sp. ASW11-19]|uniref:Fumarylacetoacetate hydrolase family protein n=1 Tax=Alteromonas salexigens TaxID=2982530 RepID=A0ABT2VU61_9ALTE|nr:fumarylacetoacetate hydrolase family protein [Alteromonas salexigens]MCU7555973.1 fumarylacetoacetate hydrolase family protein [Alteromonas salexigens]